KSFNAMAVVIPVVALAVVAGGFFLFKGINRPSATEAPASTSTSAAASETSEPTSEATEAVIPPAETATEAPPAATETVAPLPSFGGADRMAFVANNEIWTLTVARYDIEQLQND